MSGLEPCPFDGGTCDRDALIIVKHNDPSGRPGVFRGWVSCEDCGARGPETYASAESFNEAAAYGWDRRASPEALSASAPVTEEQAAAYMHSNGAIWRADNYPAGMDFSKDGWVPLFAHPAPLAADLPWREKDIGRGLILFRTSNNAHGHTNVSILSAKVDALPQVAKVELAGMMRNIAAGLSPAVPDDGPVPTRECRFSIGQPVHLAHPYPEMDPNAVFYVTGISWEHRIVSARGWNIMVASKEDIEKGYGQTDGYSPDDLIAVLQGGRL